ncbi:MAG TPA: bifunctional [glutamine synthetase] adenylyltransferase/[glutamine synthetase]-adenylyl-L-tyrosine phosphorylase [Acetobacteraceae bacterium]|nr:bifunctional [glutamine synthetase] adenylyltransferase/[glutamine synthetase]-adenylyl-L-tyrosine phosphorylase [Acetobacteraceae bacterium]
MTRFRLPPRFPAPADAPAAERLVARFAELGAAESRLAARPAALALLGALGGNSPYLSDLALREPAGLRQIVTAGPDAVVNGALARLRAMPPATPRPRLAAALRAAKRQVALAVAVADLAGIWRLPRITDALSDLAEATLSLAAAHLLRAAHDSGELRLPDPANPAHGSGLIVLAAGKLGARELNYSSDVDLVLLFDPDAGVYHGEAIASCYSRLAHGLVSLMAARDADGYVFRVDLRLRPDPAATPPAMSMHAALTYYESMGQTWERAALLKARPVAGDRALGAAFLDSVRPFVWRRYLDFAAIADIHAMKRRIDTHRGGPIAEGLDPVARLLGHNLKLGRGGIREIEFLAQTLQLVWGGREPGLRRPGTLPALGLLAAAGHLPATAAAELAAAYRFLRRTEHRLQMVADRQTHSLPDRAEAFAAIATFMGYPSPTAFARALLRHLNRVQARYAAFFESPEEPAKSAAELPRTLDFGRPGRAAPPATTAALEALGFTGAAHVAAAVQSWLSGHPRALRLPRARMLLEALLPDLLAALARQPQPDAAFARFDSVLSRLAAGVQLLSLFQRNPALIDRIAAVLGAAPSLAEHLARHPAALEGLLSPEAAAEDPVALLHAQLADATVLEEAITLTRRFVRAETFRVAVATLEGRIDVDAAGRARSDLAEAALAALLPRVLEDHATRYGRVRGGTMMVMALGKTGGREMMAGSDLDLMLIYDHPEGVSESSVPRGGTARRLPASQWFARAAHAYVAAITAPGAEGPMFAVDMRLRPSGNKGPVAVSLAAFRRYHAADAWTWERMALTRARALAGPQALRAAVAATIRAALARSDDPARIRADAAAMRARMLRELPPDGPWDVKLRSGGLIEVEFIAQVLQLVHAPARPDLCSPNTGTALARLRDAELLPAGDAALLLRAERLWRTVLSMLRLTLGTKPAREADLPEAAARALLRATAEVDVPALRATMEALAEAVRDAFRRHIGDPTTIRGET